MRSIKPFMLPFLLLWLLPLPAIALCKSFWLPHQLAQTNAESVDLIYNRRAIATIPTRWFMAVSHINKKINQASDIPAQFLLCNSDDPNAFAGSEDGQSFVALTLGMYRLLGNDWHAYAAILGHENAHLAKKHGKKRQNRQAWSNLAQRLAHDLLAKPGRNTVITSESIRIGAAAITSDYSRTEEHEADQYGMIYAHRAGFDPRGALIFHAKMKSAGNFLSSHPSSSTRISKLKKELRRRDW